MTDLDIRPITGALGADIHGLDLGEPLGTERTDAVKRALAQHLVVVFRDQDLTIEQLEAFALQLGPYGETPFVTPLEGHPNVVAVAREAQEKGALFGGTWHSDWSFQAHPPSYTILYGKEVPAHGGDTVFTNQYLAYETLSPGMRRIVEGLKAVHSADRSYGPGGTFGRPDPNSSINIQGSEAALETQVHPLVRTHPDTNRKALFINDVYTVGLDDMNAAEGAALLDFLLPHCRQIAFTCRVRWTPGAVTVWDNRCTQHHAIDDYAGSRREMYRITVAGEKPY